MAPCVEVLLKEYVAASPSSLRVSCAKDTSSLTPARSRCRKGHPLPKSLPCCGRLIVRSKELAVDRNTPIVLIGGVTYSACAPSLRNQGFNVINEAMIDHPARGGQLRFRQKLRYMLQGILPD